MNRTKAPSTKDVIAMLDDLIDDNKETLKKETTMKKVKADKKVKAVKKAKKIKADKKVTKEERRLRIEKAAKKTDGKQIVKKVSKKEKAEKATKKAERAAKKARVDEKSAREEKIAWEAEKKAEGMDSTGATNVMQSFVDEYKPAEIRAALLQLTQAKRNFLRRAIDKVDLTVEKKAATAKVDKPDKKEKTDKKAKFGHEIVRIKKSGTLMKTVYASFKELAATLKKGQTVEVAVYSTLGESRGKQRFLTAYKMVTKTAKDKHSVKKSKRPVDAE